jgi:hypothetical protein
MPPSQESPLESFTGEPLIHQLSEVGAGSEIRLAETASYERRPGGQCIVLQRFVVTPVKVAGGATGTGPGSSQPVEALLTLQYSRKAGETQLQWLVSTFQDLTQVAHPTAHL